MKLSALIITFNEERHVEQCIQSLKNVADEIIVVDSYSTDKTQEICQKHGVTVINHLYESQIEQKNFALTKAQHDFVISVDADEVLTPELQNAIKIEQSNGFPCDGYYLNRLNNYAGKWIKHGGWYPEWKLRIWNKHKAHWGGLNPHDKVVLHKSGNTKKLDGNLLHYAFESIAEHESRIDSYAAIGAKSLYDKGKKSTLLLRVFSPIVKFARDYFLNLGFLDGHAGLTIARLSARSKSLKYQKLKEMDKRK